MVNSKMVVYGIAASVLAAVVAGTAVRGGAPGGAPEPAAAASAVDSEVGERTVEDGGTGPYKAIQVSDTGLATHTIFRPKDLSAFGDKVKLPILAWGNGGCANSPSGHVNYLSEIASHGFLVVAIGPSQTGGARGGAPRGAPGGAPGGVPGGGGRAGGGGGGSSQSSQMLDAINWAIAQNKDPAGQYFNKIDIAKIGVFGHSCGGLQALEVSPDPRITTTIVVDSGILNSGGGAGGGPGAPGAGAPGGAGARAGGGMGGMPALTKDHLTKLHGPVFYLLGGESDIAYANGMDDFKRIEKLPAFVANRDVGHGGTFTRPHGAEWATVSVAWFKWQLKGDVEAEKLFTGSPCELSKMEGWKVDKKNIP
jgi:hypothetical protein